MDAVAFVFVLRLSHQLVLKTGDPESFLLLFSLWLLTALFLLSVTRGRSPSFLLFLF